MELDRERLREISAQILKTVTSPDFLNQFEAVRNAPREQRIDEAVKRLTPDAMRSAGISLPQNIRISSRYFEAGDDYSIQLGDVRDTAGRTSVVPALSKLQPGLLDKLHTQDPALLKQIVNHPFDAGFCTCVGYIGCVGVGW
jgi:hypothetical protein